MARTWPFTLSLFEICCHSFTYSFLVPPEVLCLSSPSFAARRSGAGLRSSVPTKLVIGKEHRCAGQVTLRGIYSNYVTYRSQLTLASGGARKLAAAVTNFALANRRSSSEKMHPEWILGRRCQIEWLHHLHSLRWTSCTIRERIHVEHIVAHLINALES
ncbi:hypothetical protein EDB92DRAFT_260760 [Lactarius akahatsu]|uniref:Secreted protein n=1 Tax=Lactarius akahatsu TaxID=416441 RepID=A0AAD4L5A5_9AGAM|nr:hypothetical protein EDB92DRAFT_260760 [Lactarius akahatsu]